MSLFELLSFSVHDAGLERVDADTYFGCECMSVIETCLSKVDFVNEIFVPDAESLTPFLKWAGGKRWLVDNHPDLLDVDFERYIEPFLGSGATYFKLAPKNAVLGDSNKELINAYLAIKACWEKVLDRLRVHHRKHCKEYYYKIRDSKPRSVHGKAARLIYLNRTCWNGLYRVNLSGDFNVPIGTKKDVILKTDDFLSISKLLSGARLVCADFQELIEEAREGDFVFVDPPYTIKHNNNGFVKYNESLFSWDDQIRLRDAVVSGIRKGAKFLVTNANHECIRELYKNVGELFELSRRSTISGKASYRGVYEELVIKCF